jgi:hypothetical protein
MSRTRTAAALEDGRDVEKGEKRRWVECRVGVVVVLVYRRTLGGGLP